MPDEVKRTPADNKDYFAAERTLLAWIRTGLAMMGFGFVVARFGLFLRELATARGHAPVHNTSWSLWFGTLLVVLGVVASLWSAIAHMQYVRKLDRGEHLQFRTVSPAVFTAVVLGLLGLAMAGYLALGFNEPTATTPIAPAGDTSKTPATPGR